MNARLPRDVAVRSVRAVHEGTNARRSALGREYRYDIGTTASSRSPFRSRFEWGLGRLLRLQALADAAALLPGTHDFRAFAAVGEPKPHYDCTISAASWSAGPNDTVQFTVAADRFLHHMVRLLVGTMVEIALDRRPATDMAALLVRQDNHATSAPAPAAGLRFVSALYPATCFMTDEAAW